MAKRISSKTVGQTLVLAFHGAYDKTMSEHTLVKLEGTGDEARATFRDEAGMEWEAYRYNGRWAYGSGAHRLTVPADRNEDPQPVAPVEEAPVAPKAPEGPALTVREANYLNTLRDAAENYGRALRDLQSSVEDDLKRLADGHQTSGIGNQRLVEVATYHAGLKATLGLHYNVREMADHTVWEDLIQQAYTGKVRWFMATHEA